MMHLYVYKKKTFNSFQKVDGLLTHIFSQPLSIMKAYIIYDYEHMQGVEIKISIRTDLITSSCTVCTRLEVLSLKVICWWEDIYKCLFIMISFLLVSFYIDVMLFWFSNILEILFTSNLFKVRNVRFKKFCIAIM